jgi:hypothetical protein
MDTYTDGYIAAHNAAVTLKTKEAVGALRQHILDAVGRPLKRPRTQRSWRRWSGRWSRLSGRKVRTAGSPRLAIATIAACQLTLMFCLAEQQAGGAAAAAAQGHMNEAAAQEGQHAGGWGALISSWHDVLQLIMCSSKS